MQFFSAKTKKTIRSLLASMTLSVAAGPVIEEFSSDKEVSPITQRAESPSDKLCKIYMPLCEQVEGNIPFCYKEKGSATIGCGVHFKDFKNLDNLSAIKISLKKGKSLSLRNLKKMTKMANADWKNLKTFAEFPEVASVKNVKLKDCKGDLPDPRNRAWKKDLFLIPRQTLKTANTYASNFCIQKAKELHPNLFQLPPSAQMVVVDLIYNLGFNKYKTTYPKFQRAIRQADFKTAQKECKTGNIRRDTVRSLLMNSLILVCDEKSNYSLEEIKQKHRTPALKKEYFLSMVREPKLWTLLDNYTDQNHKWYRDQKVVKLAQAMKKLVKRS